MLCFMVSVNFHIHLFILLFFLQMKTKWTEMSTVYAGPFIKNCNIEAVKKMFNSLGPVESITLVLETYMVR